MGARIAIVNYGMGNLRSVEKSFERVGCEPLLTSDPAQLADADGLVLPGVGAFPKAMQRIGELGLAEPIRTAAAGGTPVLGLCLGMQLLFERSSELGGAEGLGLLGGEVDRLQADGLKLPHIGWSPVAWERETPLSAGLADGTPFYFVHTFVARPGSEELIGSASHGERFAAVVGRHPVYGTQFHPEKSSADGLRMLANFVSLCAPVGSPS
jgi:glutamine amidotransferase